jgi:hypothetical protein
MIALDRADYLIGAKVNYFWRFLPWEEPSWEDAIILGHTAKRIRILHLNADDSGDKVKLVSPNSLYETTTVQNITIRLSDTTS